MNIVLEGPDNAGKSTLAKKLHEELGLLIRHSGGPSKFPGEVNERAKQFIADPNFYIYDRHPCISQNLYVAALKTAGELVKPETIANFYLSKPLIIYCRNNGTLDGHEQSEHSSEEYFKQVEQNFLDLCEMYDSWGLVNAHMIYRIGDDVETLIKRIKGALQ